MLTSKQKAKLLEVQCESFYKECVSVREMKCDVSVWKYMAKKEELPFSRWLQRACNNYVAEHLEIEDAEFEKLIGIGSKQEKEEY